MMAVVLASTRSMPDLDAAAIALEHVPEEVLADKESVCPTRRALPAPWPASSAPRRLSPLARFELPAGAALELPTPVEAGA